MPLPLIAVAITLIAAGGGGVTAGAVGAKDMADAKDIADSAKRRYETAFGRHGAHEATTGTHLASYGQRQLEVQTTTLADWVSWLEANERKVRRQDRTVVDGLRGTRLDLPALRKLVDQGRLLQGSVSAAVSAVVAQQAALNGVRALAVAGTGTAISGLSGAAAEGATLAWLGGGTLAAGGGGVAAGGMVLTGIAIAPALLIGGFTLAIQGDKALTQANKYEADVKTAEAEIDLQIDLMKRLCRRTDELRSVLDRLDERAIAALADLSKLDFDPDQHLELFQQTALLMAEIGRVLSAPLLTEQGDLSQESLIIIERNAA